MKMLQVLLAAGLASTLAAQNDEVVLRQRKLEAAADQLKANVIFNQQTFNFVSGQLVSGPPVKGAPYSAESVNETVQTLADGNRIVKRTSAMQYRDTEGRERREETSAMGAIFISDPVAGTRYTLHPDSQTAESGQLINATSSFEAVRLKLNTAASARAGGAGDVDVSIPLRAVVPGGRSGGPQQLVLTAIRAGDEKTEDLGKMYIEGVQAQGTRTTTTIPAGDIGNDRPINIVDEQWYSPDLQMTIATKHSDPRTGETSFALKNINRSNPPPTLFEVPSDYTMSTGRERTSTGRSPGGPARSLAGFGDRPAQGVSGPEAQPASHPCGHVCALWQDGNRYAHRFVIASRVGAVRATC